jgi:hypothetical protein
MVTAGPGEPMKIRTLASLFLLLLPLACAGVPGPNRTGDPPAWREVLAARLPRLGHRNWIVVADAAFPDPCAPGIEVVWTGADHLTVVREVLAAVDRAPHLRARVRLDMELAHVPEEHAPGTAAFREKLSPILAGRNPEPVSHAALLARLDEVGRAFRVLFLKTTLTLPYTSVFLELDCGYWSDAGEEALRRRIRQGTDRG